MYSIVLNTVFYICASGYLVNFILFFKYLFICIYLFFIVISAIQFFFPTVQHGDSVIHTCTHSIFAHYHAPS